MRIALCQIDSRVGDVRGNTERVLRAVEIARERGADLAVFPELVVTGYPPRDLLYRPALRRDTRAAHLRIAAAARGIAVVFGSITSARATRDGRRQLYNAAFLAAGGRIRAVRPKSLLPDYDVFHETRWFEPALWRRPVEIAGRAVGLLVCEDLWDDGYPVHPPAELRQAGAGLLISLNASPFREGVLDRRLAVARRAGLPVVYVNACGAEDELVFDGSSFAVDARGERLACLPRFEEAIEVVDLDAPRAPKPPRWKKTPREETLFRAVQLGTEDYFLKNGVGSAVIGLSGGIDSALTACVAAEALGPERVLGVALPSRCTDPRSVEDARSLAAALGIGFEVRPIGGLHRAAEGSLADLLGPDAGTTAENIQARLRMLVLMAVVNRRGGMVLNTSNKTELALGYGTLFGDLAGGLSPLGDLQKPDVYALARWYERRHPGAIPTHTLTRPPSAELSRDQVDPFDYPVIAPLVQRLVAGEDPEALSADGYDREEVYALARRVQGAEHKRRQGGPILKVSKLAFGAGRLVPITQAPLPRRAPASTPPAIPVESETMAALMRNRRPAATTDPPERPPWTSGRTREPSSPASSSWGSPSAS